MKDNCIIDKNMNDTSHNVDVSSGTGLLNNLGF